MKGKNVFSKREIELIESLIIKRCNAERTQQKNIRSKMRDLGFYGSDYGITDMTIDKLCVIETNGVYFSSLGKMALVVMKSTPQSCSRLNTSGLSTVHTFTFSPAL